MDGGNSLTIKQPYVGRAAAKVHGLDETAPGEKTAGAVMAISRMQLISASSKRTRRICEWEWGRRIEGEGEEVLSSTRFDGERKNHLDANSALSGFFLFFFSSSSHLGYKGVPG